MQKWADYLISAVRYNREHTHIVEVWVHEDNGSTVGIGSSWSRQRVIVSIKNGLSFFTIYKDREGKWQRGQKVIVVNIFGVEYIKTTDNGKASDNLENLPEF